MCLRVVRCCLVASREVSRFTKDISLTRISWLHLPHTLVVFESPRRVGEFLADALVVLGDRRAAVCVELTKKFEKVHRGYLGDLADAFAERKVKGEVTVVIAGNHPKFIRGED